MNNSMSLYRMEMRKNRGYFAVILALQLIYICGEYAQYFYQYVTKSSYVPQFVGVTGVFLLFATLFSFPLMMLFSWYRDEKNNTSYQMLSCPIRPHEILKNKVKAFLSFGLIWMVIFETYFLFREYEFSSERWSKQFELIDLLGFIIRFFPFLVLAMGFACLVIGVQQMVKQYRLLIGTGVIVAGASFYIRTSRLWSSFYLDMVNNRLRGVIDTHSPLVSFLIHTILPAYPLLIGIACMYTGFFLFEKFSEV